MFFNNPSSPYACGESTPHRKQSKQEIEKIRRDRMNVSIDNMKEHVLNFMPNQTTKLEKADILEQMDHLFVWVKSEMDRLQRENECLRRENKRLQRAIHTIMQSSNLSEAKQVAYNMMSSTPSAHGVRVPAMMPQMTPSFGFIGFPAMGMGIPPLLMMPQQPTMQFPMPVPHLMQQVPNMETRKSTEKVKMIADNSENVLSDDEAIDIETSHEETFSDVSTPGSSRGTKQKLSLSDDSGIAADATPPKEKRNTNVPKSISFGIDRFLVS